METGGGVPGTPFLLFGNWEEGDRSQNKQLSSIPCCCMKGWDTAGISDIMWPLGHMHILPLFVYHSEKVGNFRVSGSYKMGCGHYPPPPPPIHNLDQLGGVVPSGSLCRGLPPLELGSGLKRQQSY